MPSKPTDSKSKTGGALVGENVEAFVDALDHPCKQEILALRRIILGADSSIAEGIKWNAPSFRTSEYFATMHLRAKEGMQVILHLGAKKREHSLSTDPIPDPASLLEWLAGDRAVAKFRDMEDIKAKESAFAELIRHWIKHV